MKRFGRVGLGAAVLCLTMLMILLVAASMSQAAPVSGTVDMTVEMEAPTHIKDGAEYKVRLAYYNFGPALPQTVVVTVSLPASTTLLATTDRWGTPLPANVTDGLTMSWTFIKPDCNAPLNANCGHILFDLAAEKDLDDGAAFEMEAWVTATEETDTNPTNNYTSIETRTGAMAGSGKQVQTRQAMPGDVLIYTITLDRAPGSEGKQGEMVYLTDTIPFSHQVRFLGWQGEITGTMHEPHAWKWAGQVQAGRPITIQYRLGIEGVVTPGTVISNAAMLRWGEQLMQLGPVSTVVTLPHGSLALGPNQGGQAYHSHGVTLTVPPGAVSDTTRFQIGPLYTDTHPGDAPPGLIYAKRAFELNAYRFEHQVREFNTPLSITVGFSGTDAPGIKRETVRLFTRKSTEEPWESMGEPARMMSGTHEYTATHFSEFAFFGRGEHQIFLPVALRGW